MIRRDPVDAAVEQSLPHGFDFVARAQRRRAFAEGPQPLEIGFVQQQIVRTGLDAHVLAVPTSRGDRPGRAGGADMHEVQARAGRLRSFERRLDGVELGRRRPRGGPVQGVPSTFGARTLAQLDDNLGAARLHLDADETARLNDASDPGAADYPYGAPGIEQRSRKVAGGR